MDVEEDNTAPEGDHTAETKETQDPAKILEQVQWVVAQVVRLRTNGLSSGDNHESIGRIVNEARRLSNEGLYDLDPETQEFLNSMLKASTRP